MQESRRQPHLSVNLYYQRWSPRGRSWPRGRPRGHILKSLALASSIPVLCLESVCPWKGCPWPRIFFVSLALASSLVSSTPPLSNTFFSYIWFKYDILLLHCCDLCCLVVNALAFQPSYPGLIRNWVMDPWNGSALSIGSNTQERERKCMEQSFFCSKTLHYS